ncbi:hypothetical protein CPB84DRAFT_1868184 [Gymnopilus junonius]|uniref:Uncharacterized protein n=1 Tax=Gymnopilus junonius TaxID=109634 RepID=A0A9P5TS55_GYMJU|nr:hypothetical protein CPB84DRAFT_1868184 [Gymnopilus junonius]
MSQLFQGASHPGILRVGRLLASCCSTGAEPSGGSEYSTLKQGRSPQHANQHGPEDKTWINELQLQNRRLRADEGLQSRGSIRKRRKANRLRSRQASGRMNPTHGPQLPTLHSDLNVSNKFPCSAYDENYKPIMLRNLKDKSMTSRVLVPLDGPKSPLWPEKDVSTHKPESLHPNRKGTLQAADKRDDSEEALIDTEAGISDGSESGNAKSAGEGERSTGNEKRISRFVEAEDTKSDGALKVEENVKKLKGEWTTTRARFTSVNECSAWTSTKIL